MAMVRCESCGNTIRVQGLAAICPHCGQLVMGATELPPPELLRPQRSIPLQAMPAEPAGPAPAPLPRQIPPPEKSYTLHFLIGGVIGLLVILIATVIIVSTAGRTAPPPGPVAVAPTPKPAATEAKGSEWFSETPLPATKPIEAETEPPAPRPVPPPPPHAELAKLRPTSMPVIPDRVTDEQIGLAITRGVKWLNSRFGDSRLLASVEGDPETFAGLDALAVYALLHSGQAIGDANLGSQSEFVRSLLNRLKEFPMNGNRATYSRSLRISALSVFNRPDDRQAIQDDLDWLLKASMQGAYHYDLRPPGTRREANDWDNSNSQYGALGVWAAAEAGYKVPSSYWIDVEQHWQQSQTPTGGWGYSPGDTGAKLSMSVAGLTMLFVARDQMALNNPPSNSYVPLTRAQVHALEWLDEGENVLNVDAGHRGYTLYGLERAGLASGYKFFGGHDWYLELARQLIESQKPDGSFEGGDGPVAETSFALLFLSRGRHPVLFAKLKFDGNWNNRPRDLQVLSHFASRQLERPINWQIADVRREWWDWSDAAVLLITSDRAPRFTAADIDRLRAFALNGGLILTQGERNSPEFNAFADDLAKKLFPNLPYEAIPPTHPIFSTVYPMQAPPALKGVSNGVRLLMVHSATDLARQWQPHPSPRQRTESEIAINIAIYGAGLRDLRNRVSSTYIPPPRFGPIGAVPLARLKYAGNWDPEPAAWPREARLLCTTTAIDLRIEPTEIRDLNYDRTPLATLTGTVPFDLSEADLNALRLFVTKGGVLLIDSCGGSREFSDFAETRLLPGLFADARLEPLPTSHPLLAGRGPGMRSIRDMRLRAGMVNATPQILGYRAGHGQLLFSRLDITSGLLGANTVGITGFHPRWCEDFGSNLVLWTIARLTQE